MFQGLFSKKKGLDLICHTLLFIALSKLCVCDDWSSTRFLFGLSYPRASLFGIKVPIYLMHPPQKSQRYDAVKI